MFIRAILILLIILLLAFFGEGILLLMKAMTGLTIQ